MKTLALKYNGRIRFVCTNHASGKSRSVSKKITPIKKVCNRFVKTRFLKTIFGNKLVYYPGLVLSGVQI